MLTIIFFYCNDRLNLFEKTIKCLENVELFEECEKIICSDGSCSFSKKNYKIIEVNRDKKDYNWSKIWNIAVEKSQHEILWYLDCDRIVPKNYLIDSLNLLSHDTWIYPKNTFRIKCDIDIEKLLDIQDGKFKNLLCCENRTDYPPNKIICQSAKNPFSGNTLFTKNEYIKYGGLDVSYEGYGYADLDFYMHMHNKGINFNFSRHDEYHQYHETSNKYLRDFKMTTYNALMFCKKWNLQPNEKIVEMSLKYNIKFDDVVIGQKFSKYENKYLKKIFI